LLFLVETHAQPRSRPEWPGDSSLIRFTCPRCGMQLSAPEDCAGRSSKCRQCGQPITVPQPVAVAVPAIPPPPPTDVVPGRRMSPRPAPLMDGARVISILLLSFGGVVLHMGCCLTGYFVALFDTRWCPACVARSKNAGESS